MTPVAVRAIAVCALLTLAATPPHAHSQVVDAARTLDRFDSIAGWHAFPSEGVQLELRPGEGVTGQALTMDFDFRNYAGYAIARKAFALGTLTGNWSLSFRVRGEMPANTLELKLVDRSGDNVWWYTVPEYRAPQDWQPVVVRQREVSFAWGPIGGGPPTDIAAIEIVITAGQGGQGSMSVDDLIFTPLAPDVPVSSVTVSLATGTRVGSNAGFAIDNDSTTSWHADAGGALILDLGGVRTYGGLVIDWASDRQPSRAVVDTSNNASTWSYAGEVMRPHGGRSYLPLPNGSSRYVRLTVPREATIDGFAISHVAIRPLAFAETPTALLRSIAGEAPAGRYPRAMRGEQVYWTVVGVSGGRSEALLSEDGQLELGKRAPSLEPFLTIGDSLITWHNVTAIASLMHGVRPIPTVEWTSAQAMLRVTAFAAGTVSDASVYARYRVTNRTATALRGTFWLALRPMQVNPPWQFLNTPGGAARVDSLRWNGSSLLVNESLHVMPLTTPSRVGVSTLDAGEAIDWIGAGIVPSEHSVHDPRGLASAVFAWDLDLAPGDSAEISISAPLDGDGDPESLSAFNTLTFNQALESRLFAVEATWAIDQDAVALHLPATAPPIADAIKANLAWILINRDSAGIQPGSRSYERSWIRDGSLTAEALLRLGRSAEAREFAEWYASFQYPSGKVPCCVDARGADPVDEHDSHGQLVHLVHEVWRYTGDRDFAERLWPHVRAAAIHIDSLRRTHLTPEYNTPALLPYRGLLPPSISHEGYSAKPMHSFWDDGFALLGVGRAAELAQMLGHVADASRFAEWRAAFSDDVHAALRRTMEMHRISYLPGSVELGDFDATSTTTLITPVGELARLPRAALDATFDRYVRAARHRSNPDSLWNDYTPYEWRTVGTLLRLNRKSDALDLVTQFMRDRRPAAWHHWAEVVWRDARLPRFIGDMPHTWVGSDFIRSALDLFAYERHADSALVIAGGVAESWLVPNDSVIVRGLRTPWGPLGYRMSRAADTVTIRFDPSDARRPAGGFVVHTPLAARIVRARADGVAVRVSSDNTIVLSRLPAQLVLIHE